jgi:hypothetical protein
MGGHQNDNLSEVRKDEILAGNGVPVADRLQAAIPTMAEGDLGLEKGRWCKQLYFPRHTIFVKEVHYRYLPAKPVPPSTRWLADIGQILCWGSGMLAMAILCLAAYDTYYALEHPGALQSALTLYLTRQAAVFRQTDQFIKHFKRSARPQRA